MAENEVSISPEAEFLDPLVSISRKGAAAVGDHSPSDLQEQVGRVNVMLRQEAKKG